MSEEVIQVGSRVRAAFDFKANDEKELSVKEGDLLEVLDIMNEWLLVTLVSAVSSTLSVTSSLARFSSVSGFVPKSFVTVEVDNIVAGCVVSAIADFQAEADQELSVSENERLIVRSIENGWCTAESLDRGAPPGLVPLSYLRYHPNQDTSSFNTRNTAKRLNKQRSSKGVWNFTYLLVEPPGPAIRRFYDEILDPLERTRVLQNLTEKGKIFQQTAYELLVTEGDYVRDIKVIIDIFFNPLVAEKIVSQQSIIGIFSEELPNLHKIHDVFYQRLLGLRQKGIINPGIPKAFDQLLGTFQSYGRYFVNHASATKLLQSMKKNRSFATFLKTCESNPQCKNLGIESYLIKPIQRLTKYPLLLKELFDTCEDPDEAQRIEAVLDRIKEIVSQLNDEQRSTENREQVLEVISKFGDKNEKKELAEKLTPKAADLSKDSLLIRHGKLALFSNGTSQGDVHVYLFTDYIAIGKRAVSLKLTKSPLKLLHFCSSKEYTLKRGQKKGTFIIHKDHKEQKDPHSSNKTVFTLTSSDNHYEAWVSAFEEAGFLLPDPTGSKEFIPDPEPSETIVDSPAEIVEPLFSGDEDSGPIDDDPILKERRNYRESVISQISIDIRPYEPKRKKGSRDSNTDGETEKPNGEDFEKKKKKNIRASRKILSPQIDLLQQKISELERAQREQTDLLIKLLEEEKGKSSKLEETVTKMAEAVKRIDMNLVKEQEKNIQLLKQIDEEKSVLEELKKDRQTMEEKIIQERRRTMELERELFSPAKQSPSTNHQPITTQASSGSLQSTKGMNRSFSRNLEEARSSLHSLRDHHEKAEQESHKNHSYVPPYVATYVPLKSTPNPKLFRPQSFSHEASTISPELLSKFGPYKTFRKSSLNLIPNPEILSDPKDSKKGDAD